MADRLIAEADSPLKSMHEAFLQSALENASLFSTLPLRSTYQWAHTLHN